VLPKQKCIFLVNSTTLAKKKMTLNMDATSWCNNDIQYSLNSGVIQVNERHLYLIGGQGERYVDQLEIENNFQQRCV
jgi:hypothetical protein